MPQLLDSICTIIGTFHKYAKWHEDCSTLNRKEMKKLIQKEFAIILENQLDAKTAELIFQMLDINGDGMVDFNEYLMLLFNSAKACYRHLQSRECLLQEEDGRGPSQEEVHRDPWEHRQLDEDEREGHYIRGRPDSGRTRHRPIEGTTQGERRDCLPQSRERSSQAHDSERGDDHGRDRSFHGSEDEYKGRPQRSGTRADVETRPQTRRLEPERDQAGRHELRRREAAGEEDRQRQSQELVPRSNDEGRHPTYGSQPWGGEERERYAPEGPERQEGRRHSWAPATEHQLDEENLTRKRPSEPRVDEESHRRRPRAPEETQHDGGQCHPSSGSQEWTDRRRRDSSDEQEIQDKLSSRDPERWQDLAHHRKPVGGVDEYFPLPREGERRSKFCDPEREQRRSHTHESKHRERSWPSEPDRQDGEWTGQRRGRTQYRGAEHETDQPSGPEVRQAERRLPHGDHTRCPRPWQPRAEVEDRQRSRDPEGREQDRSRPRPHPYEPESTGSGRGWSQSYASESREGLSRRPRRHDDDDARRQHFHLDEEVDRRRPWFPEPEPRDYGRPGRQEWEDSQGRHHYDGAEPQERESHRRRPQLHDPESREGQRRSAPQTGLRDDQRERPRPRYTQTRPTEQDRFYSPESGPRDRFQHRPQTYNYQSSEQGECEWRRTQSYDTEALDYGPSQMQAHDADPRDGEDERQTLSHYAGPRDQRRTWTYEWDPIDYDQQRRHPSYDTDATNADQRRTHTQDGEQRYGEPWRRTPPRNIDAPSVDQRQAQASEIGPRDWEQQKQTQGYDTRQRGSEPRQTITHGLDSRDTERQRTLSHGPDARTVDLRRTQKKAVVPRDHGAHDANAGGADERQTQIGDPRENAEQRQREGDQKQTQSCDMDPSHEDQQCRTSSFDGDLRDVEQKQTQACHVDLKNDKQRRTPVHETVTRKAEQRRTQMEDVAPKDGEHQRHTQIYDNGQRGTERRGTQTGEPDPRPREYQRRTLVSDRRDGGQRQIQKPEDPKDGQQQEKILKSDARDRGIDQGQTQTGDVDPRCREEQRLILPHDSTAVNVDQRQNQPQDVGSDSTQQRQTPSHDTDQEAAEEREVQASRVDPRTSGEQRQTPPPRGTDLWEGDQGQTQVHEVDPRGDDAKRLSKPQAAEQKGTKQVKGIPSDVAEGEQGRTRWTACDPGARSNVCMGPGEPESEAARTCRDPTLSSTPQEGERSRPCPHGAVPMASQLNRYQLPAPEAPKGALGGHRPPEPAEAPQRESGQETSQLQKTKLEQAARRSHGMRGPELRRPDRSRAQPQSTEPQEGEPRRQKAQEPGSPGSAPAVTQPHEAQSQRGRPQVREAEPEPRAGGKPGALQLPERGRLQDPSGGPEQLQPVVQRTSREGGAGQLAPARPQSEGDDESSQRARDPQPPLEEESQSGGAEGQSHSGSQESDASREQPGDLCQAKMPVVCNPLYEYLVAQKKQEQL